MHIRPLDGEDHRDAFQCGNDHLDEYLKRTARQHQQKHIARVFVAVDESAPHDIMGYYTLAACEIQLPRMFVRSHRPRLPAHPIPGLLGRLAVGQCHQQKGVGTALLRDAILRFLKAVDQVGMAALVVDAKPNASGFYQQLGFQRLSDHPPRLALMTGMARSALKNT